MRKLNYIFLLSLMIFSYVLCWCDRAEGAERILFIAHDNRPISMQQTAEVVEQAGYELVMPPEELLSRGENEPGNPEELWKWLDEKADSARAAVVSSDSMLYGGLIASRKHDISDKELQERVKRFKKFHSKNPHLKLYVFGSLMRTPKSGAYAGNEEPEYYRQYGADIFRYTALADKADMKRISFEERADLKKLRKEIPPSVLGDWMSRREKNFAATKTLMDMTKKGIVSCFIVGRDDNAPFCQTHRENRELNAYAKEKRIPKDRFRIMTGIDEFNLLLLTRAVNDMRQEMPFVHVIYNEGLGEKTVPSFSSESIGESIRDSVILAGGMLISKPRKADFVLLVNTDPKGRTGEASEVTPGVGPLGNDGRNREGSNHFLNLVEECVKQGYPVGVADIAFSNGADNALMANLRRRGLLDKIRVYSGWNTATNSTGFALGTGMLAPHMTEAGRRHLLTRRYLDDWAYQANVRQMAASQLWEEGRWEAYTRLDGMRSLEEERVGWLLREFARENLPPFEGLKDLRVSFPWNRMFECQLFF